MKTNSCLICGEGLTYSSESVGMTCMFCKKTYESKTSCKRGHFICDNCHSESGINVIQYLCNNEKSKNPYEIVTKAMDEPFVHTHGPEHHILTGAAVLTAYKNSGGDIDLKRCLKEMVKRGKQVPGGVCGFWGACGSGISCGQAISIITQATPLSTDPWKLSNEMTAIALKRISEKGGPRCCKRNVITSVLAATQFINNNFDVQLEMPSKVVCTFSHNNEECLHEKCPFYGKQKAE